MIGLVVMLIHYDITKCVDSRTPCTFEEDEWALALTGIYVIPRDARVCGDPKG